MDNELRRLKMTADIDQAIEGARQLATLLRAYYQFLREQGFTTGQAMQLTAEYQAAVLAMGPKQRP